MRYLPILALLLTACNPIQPSPTAPTPLPVAAPAPAPPPAPSGPPFTSQLVSNASTVFTDTVWTGGLNIVLDQTQVSPPRPSVVTVNCGNGSAVQTWPGFSGQIPISCLFSAPGTFSVTTAAVASDGYTASAATSVTATLRPAAPAPTPAPTPAPAPVSPRVSVFGAPNFCTSSRAFWAFSASANVPVDLYTFNFGDGSAVETSDSGQVGHAYDETGYRTVTVTARRKDSDDTITGSVLIFVRLGCTIPPS